MFKFYYVDNLLYSSVLKKSEYEQVITEKILLFFEPLSFGVYDQATNLSDNCLLYKRNQNLGILGYFEKERALATENIINFKFKNLMQQFNVTLPTIMGVADLLYRKKKRGGIKKYKKEILWKRKIPLWHKYGKKNEFFFDKEILSLRGDYAASIWKQKKYHVYNEYTFKGKYTVFNYDQFRNRFKYLLSKSLIENKTKYGDETFYKLYYNFNSLKDIDGLHRIKKRIGDKLKFTFTDEHIKGAGGNYGHRVFSYYYYNDYEYGQILNKNNVFYKNYKGLCVLSQDHVSKSIKYYSLYRQNLESTIVINIYKDYKKTYMSYKDIYIKGLHISKNKLIKGLLNKDEMPDFTHLGLPLSIPFGYFKGYLNEGFMQLYDSILDIFNFILFRHVKSNFVIWSKDKINMLHDGLFTIKKLFNSDITKQKLTIKMPSMNVYQNFNKYKLRLTEILIRPLDESVSGLHKYNKLNSVYMVHVFRKPSMVHFYSKEYLSNRYDTLFDTLSSEAMRVVRVGRYYFAGDPIQKIGELSLGSKIEQVNMYTGAYYIKKFYVMPAKINKLMLIDNLGIQIEPDIKLKFLQNYYMQFVMLNHNIVENNFYINLKRKKQDNDAIIISKLNMAKKYLQKYKDASYAVEKIKKTIPENLREIFEGKKNAGGKYKKYDETYVEKKVSMLDYFFKMSNLHRLFQVKAANAGSKQNLYYLDKEYNLRRKSVETSLHGNGKGQMYANLQKEQGYYKSSAINTLGYDTCIFTIGDFVIYNFFGRYYFVYLFMYILCCFWLYIFYYCIKKLNKVIINGFMYVVVTKKYLVGLGYSTRKGHILAYDNRETYKIKDQYKINSKLIPYDLSGDYDETYDPMLSAKTKYSIKLSGQFKLKQRKLNMDYDFYLQYEKKMYDSIINKKKYNTLYRSFEHKRLRYIIEENDDLGDYLLKYTDTLDGDVNVLKTDETLFRAFELRMGNKYDDVYDETAKKDYYFEDYYASVYVNKKEAEISLSKVGIKANIDNIKYNRRFTLDYLCGMFVFRDKKINELLFSKLNVKKNKEKTTAVVFSYFNFIGQEKYDGFFSMIYLQNL